MKRNELGRAISSALGIDTKVTLLAAGLIFLLALVLGVWKYRQIMASDERIARIPTSTSRTGRRCSTPFATLLIAIFVELSAWPAWVNLTAAGVVVFFFVGASSATSSRCAARHRAPVRERRSAKSALAMALLIDRRDRRHSS